MKIGNIIAGALLLPFIVVSYILISTAGNSSHKHDGAIIISMIISTFTFLGSALYLVIINANRLENSSIVKLNHKCYKYIRVTILILLAIVSIITLSPSKHPPRLRTPNALTSFG